MTAATLSPIKKISISPVVIHKETEASLTHIYAATLIGIAMEREVKARVTEGNLASKLVRAGITPKTLEDIYQGRYEVGVAELLRILDVMGLNGVSFFNRLNLYVREVTVNRNMVVLYNSITPITDKTFRTQIDTLLHGRGSLYQQAGGTSAGYRPNS